MGTSARQRGLVGEVGGEAVATTTPVRLAGLAGFGGGRFGFRLRSAVVQRDVVAGGSQVQHDLAPDAAGCPGDQYDRT